MTRSTSDDIGARRAEGAARGAARRRRPRRPRAPPQTSCTRRSVAERERAQPDDVARQAEIAHRGEEQEERLEPVRRPQSAGGISRAGRDVGEQDRRDPHELGEGRGAARAQEAPGGVRRRAECPAGRVGRAGAPGSRPHPQGRLDGAGALVAGPLARRTRRALAQRVELENVVAGLPGCQLEHDWRSTLQAGRGPAGRCAALATGTSGPHAVEPVVGECHPRRAARWPAPRRSCSSPSPGRSRAPVAAICAGSLPPTSRWEDVLREVALFAEVGHGGADQEGDFDFLPSRAPRPSGCGVLPSGPSCSRGCGRSRCGRSVVELRSTS